MIELFGTFLMRGFHNKSKAIIEDRDLSGKTVFNRDTLISLPTSLSKPNYI